MSSNNHKQWLLEYNEFCNEPGEAAPAHLLKNVRTILFPNPWIVFSKLAVIHGVVGFFSLAICNQFGLNPFNTPYSLADLFMKIAGHHFCMLACGVLFISTTYLFANIFLSLEELEAVRRYEWLQLAVLSLASLALFYFLGAELVFTFVALWLLGALVGGLASIEFLYKMRREMMV